MPDQETIRTDAPGSNLYEDTDKLAGFIQKKKAITPGYVPPTAELVKVVNKYLAERPTPKAEINSELVLTEDIANFLLSKGQLEMSKPTPSGDVQVTNPQEEEQDNIARFIKSKGYEPIGYVSKTPPSTPPVVTTTPQEPGDWVNRDRQATIGPNPNPETLGGQLKDVAKKGKILPWQPGSGVLYSEYLSQLIRGLTMGNWNPDKMFSWLQSKGFPVVDKATRDQYFRSKLGYLPNKVSDLIGGGASTVGNMVSMTPLFGQLPAAAAAVTKVPLMQAIYRGTVGGLLVGLARKPEERDTLLNRLSQVPTDVMLFTAMDVGMLTAGKAAEVINWNRQYRPEYERISKEYGPISGEDIRSLRMKIEVGEKLTDTEQSIFEEIRGTNCGSITKEMIRRGWFRPPTARVPYRPKMGDILRDTSTLPATEPFPWERPVTAEPTAPPTPAPGTTANEPPPPYPTPGPTPPPSAQPTGKEPIVAGQLRAPVIETAPSVSTVPPVTVQEPIPAPTITPVTPRVQPTPSPIQVIPQADGSIKIIPQAVTPIATPEERRLRSPLLREAIDKSKVGTANKEEMGIVSDFMRDDKTNLGNAALGRIKPKARYAAFIDLDNVKFFNDDPRFGHDWVDTHIINPLADKLTDEFNSVDNPMQWGAWRRSGDEFIVESNDLNSLETYMEQLQTDLSEGPAPVRFSYGIDSYSSDTKTGTLDSAEKAMMRNKKLRRNQGMTTPRGEEPQDIERYLPGQAPTAGPTPETIPAPAEAIHWTDREGLDGILDEMEIRPGSWTISPDLPLDIENGLKFGIKISKKILDEKGYAPPKNKTGLTKEEQIVERIGDEPIPFEPISFVVRNPKTKIALDKLLRTRGLSIPVEVIGPPVPSRIAMPVEAPTATRLVGEGAASGEAISRQKKYSYFAYDTRTKKTRPLIGVDAIDYQAQPTEIKIQENKLTGRKEIIDRGSAVSPTGVPVEMIPKEGQPKTAKATAVSAARRSAAPTKSKMVESGPIKVTPELAKSIASEVQRLTKGDNFPGSWRMDSPEEIDDNRQNLSLYTMQHYDPASGPLENYINANKNLFHGGRWPGEDIEGVPETIEGRQRIRRTEQMPEIEGKEGTTSEFVPSEAENVFAGESIPKGKVATREDFAVGDSERATMESKLDEEELRVLDTLKSAVDRYNKTIKGSPEQGDKFLKAVTSRLLEDNPPSLTDLSKEFGIPKSSLDRHINGILATLKDSPELQDIMLRHIQLLHAGIPMPTKRDLESWVKFINTYFTVTRGMDAKIDRAKDLIFNKRSSELFGASIDLKPVIKWFKTMPPGTSDMAHALFTGQMTGDGKYDLQLSALPDNVKAPLLKLRDVVDRLSMSLVSMGAAPGPLGEVIERHTGTYLTGMYKIYTDRAFMPTQQVIDNLKNLVVREEHLTPDQAQNWIDGEIEWIKDNFRKGTIIGKKRHTIDTRSFKHRVVMSPEYRAFLGPVTDLPRVLIHTISRLSSMHTSAFFLSYLHDNLPELWVESERDAMGKGWQHGRLSDRLEYGKMAGKYVDPEFMRYLEAEVQVQLSETEKLIGQFFLTPFKWSKTIGSIPNQARNFLGNIMLSILSENNLLNPLNLPYYLKSARVHLRRLGADSELWRQAIEQGVTETGFFAKDVPQLAKDLTRMPPETFIGRTFNALVRRPIHFAEEMYSSGDTIFRLAAHLHNLKRGMTPEESVAELNISFQNYRKLPLAVDWLRRYPVMGVFIAYQANLVIIAYAQAAKAVSEIKSPNPKKRAKGFGRLLRWAAAFVVVPMAIEKISSAMSGVSDEDREAINELLPENKKYSRFLYSRGKDGRIVMVDLSTIWPSGNFERVIQGLWKGDIKTMSDAASFMDIPFIQMIQIATEGKDYVYGGEYPTFLGRMEAIIKNFYLPMSSPVPSLHGLAKGEIVPGTFTGPHVKKIIDAINKVPEPKTQRLRDVKEELVGFFTGLTRWHVDLRGLYGARAGEIKKEFDSIKREIYRYATYNTAPRAWEVKMETDKLKKQLDQLGKRKAKLDAAYMKLRDRGLVR